MLLGPPPVPPCILLAPAALQLLLRVLDPQHRVAGDALQDVVVTGRDLNFTLRGHLSADKWQAVILIKM